ncbi:MAG: hypothetical protein ABI212_08385 [Burkholderiaceae bacterium]
MQLCVHAAPTLLMACFLGLGVAGVITAGMVGAGYWGFLQSAVLVGPCARKAWTDRWGSA